MYSYEICVVDGQIASDVYYKNILTESVKMTFTNATRIGIIFCATNQLLSESVKSN